MAEQIEATFPRDLMMGHPAYQWQLMKDDKGFYVQTWVDINKMSLPERQEYESWAGCPDADMDAHYESTIPRFRTPELARKWASLQDEQDNLHTDIHAMHAPSECYAGPWKNIEAREHDLLTQAI